jgi:hypothetical protein
MYKEQECDRLSHNESSFRGDTERESLQCGYFYRVQKGSQYAQLQAAVSLVACHITHTDTHFHA